MSGKVIFLNYGMKNGEEFDYYGWMSEDRETISSLIEKGKEEYIYFDSLKQYLSSEVGFSAQGIHFSVYKMGVHRALLCELPDNPPPSAKTQQLFALIQTKVREIYNRAYDWRRQNCIMAVIEVLNVADSFTKKPMNMPWEIDKALERYCGWYPEGTTEAAFMRKYQDLVHEKKEDAPYWSVVKGRKINSLQDILANAYSLTLGELTRKALLRLKWITVSPTGFLEPTRSAPEDFQEAFKQYDQNRTTLLHAQSSTEIKSASDFSAEVKQVQMPRIEAEESGKANRVEQKTTSAKQLKGMKETFGAIRTKQDGQSAERENESNPEKKGEGNSSNIITR